ncbi:3-ketoacyl-CoA thiolase [Coprinopsis cinerea AmutBmut pab1-1]|nr:3-ketoacyl-CoA thiolase [Coprinopsis cinerea AmutBmut pab1-1]
MFTRQQFEAACKSLATKWSSESPLDPRTHAYTDWVWHNPYPYGYLARTKRYARTASPGAFEEELGQELGQEFGQEEVVCQDDVATGSTPGDVESVLSQQFVVFSATFQVPAFYFTVHDTTGAPLSLDKLLASPLFKFELPEGAASTGFALTLPNAPFPLLSQGEHPSLGTPCWYLHPCETERAVEELVREAEQPDWTPEHRLERWLELWLMAVGAVLNLFLSWHQVQTRQTPFSYKDMLLSRLATTTRFSTPSFTRSMSNEVVIVSASRTPVGSFNGALKSFTAPQLGSIALKHALESKNIDPALVEEVYFGNVVQAGVGQSPARQVALGAGLRTSSDATTINKVCASGMKSIMLAAQSIKLGERSVVAAGGMESMSNAPFLLPRQNPAFGKFTTRDSLENDGLWDVYNNFAMGNCGEHAAEKHGLTRQSLDEHAIESYKRAARAWKEGAFDAEVVPVTVKGKKGDTIVREDEEFTRVIFDKVPSLRSAFKNGGVITAANSSPLSDGASALILMSADKAKELGLAPLAKVVSWADAGTEPIDFPEAPTVALPKALEKANLTVNDISLFELNEAFSVVVRIAEKVCNIDPAKINVNGGAVALGHAIGNSGSRIIVSLVHALKSGQYGAAAICNGGGAASALVVQKL